MKPIHFIAAICFGLLLQSCSSARKTTRGTINNGDITSTVIIKNNVPPRTINTKNVDADDLVTYAETLQGVPYKYGSAVKENGFDCSGFITYVFNHFKISVPRTSVDFTNAGKPVSIKESKRGDIILFTGSNANSGVVGHMGIITGNKNNSIEFIHSASGNSRGVMISGMNSYFIPRFVKVIRIFSMIP